MYAGAILMDLLKAFDCLPHELLCEKFVAYGLDQNPVELIQNYLSSNKECVQIGNYRSSFMDILKGVPQGSILGQICFHFINSKPVYQLERCWFLGVQKQCRPLPVI